MYLVYSIFIVIFHFIWHLFAKNSLLRSKLQFRRDSWANWQHRDVTQTSRHREWVNIGKWETNGNESTAFAHSKNMMKYNYMNSFLTERKTEDNVEIRKTSIVLNLVTLRVRFYFKLTDLSHHYVHLFAAAAMHNKINIIKNSQQSFILCESIINQSSNKSNWDPVGEKGTLIFQFFSY